MSKIGGGVYPVAGENKDDWGPTNLAGSLIGRSDPYATRKVEQLSQCRSFVVPEGQEVQFNVVAFMYYKGKRISKLVDSYRKELHPKITQELHAMNLALADTDNYVYVSICSPRARYNK